VTEIQTSRAKGSILMDDCLAALVSSGRVRSEDAFMKALDKNSFLKKVQAGRYSSGAY
jgi:Tfp pilus assembly pilus retraction ATPase PilT